MEAKILLADTHPIITRSVLLLPAMRSRTSTIREVHSCRELLEAVEVGQYDYLLSEISFSDGAILNWLPKVKNGFPQLKVGILTGETTKVYKEVLAQYGIALVISKASPMEEIEQRIEEFLRPAVPGCVHSDRNNPFQGIGRRQLEVLRYWLKGRGTKETAAAMDITMATVSTVKARLLEKTGMENFVQLSDLARLYADQVNCW